jgi:hypothetical protein
MQMTRVRVLVVSIVFVTASVVGWAQKGDLTHEHAATPNANVGFGDLPLPTVALGPPPCIQPTIPPAPPAPIGGPTDPCAYKSHHLTPEEVTIEKEGEVTFQIHGGGHAMAIYEVSKDTTRDDIGQYLCPGFDRTQGPASHPCLGTDLAKGGANAAANHNIADGHGNVVIIASAAPFPPPPPPPPIPHPDNRVWSPEGRLMSAGGQQFLNGGAPANPATTPPTPEAPGQLITYQFLKTGRYLVICMNRSHLLNDWMFGFVNVVGE